MTGPDPALLRLRELGAAYGDTPVFRSVNLALRRGEFVALLGDSGVGKSTLLNCIAGLELPREGCIEFQPEGDTALQVQALDADARAHLRRRHLGFVFQAFHVLPHLTVAENVGLPLRLLGHPGAAMSARVDALLAAVGLQGLHARRPSQLSGGQLQRVAIARALVHRPALVLADEPTGNLDPGTAARVLEVLVDQVRQQGGAGLLVTHSQAAAARADRVLRLTAEGMREAARPAPEAAGPAQVG